MRSKIVIQKPTATGIGLIGLDSLLDVYDNTKAGDVVIVYPGTYDIGNNSIQLKDGVHWHFFPGVTITSSSTGGTFKDNNVQCNLRFDGFPTIENTNGLDKRIVLQHASSRMDGFYWEYDAILNMQYEEGAFASTSGLTIFKNTIGENLTYSYNSQEEFIQATISSPLFSNAKFEPFNFPFLETNNNALVAIILFVIDSTTLQLATAPYVTGFEGKIHIQFRIYP